MTGKPTFKGNDTPGIKASELVDLIVRTLEPDARIYIEGTYHLWAVKGIVKRNGLAIIQDSYDDEPRKTSKDTSKG